MKEPKSNLPDWPIVGTSECPTCQRTQPVAHSVRCPGKIACLVCMEIFEPGTVVWVEGKEPRDFERARDAEGKFLADKEETLDVDEAWVDEDGNPRPVEEGNNEVET